MHAIFLYAHAVPFFIQNDHTCIVKANLNEFLKQDFQYVQHRGGGLSRSVFWILDWCQTRIEFVTWYPWIPLVYFFFIYNKTHTLSITISQTLVPQCVTQSSNIVKKGASAFSKSACGSGSPFADTHTSIYTCRMCSLMPLGSIECVYSRFAPQVPLCLTVVVNWTLTRNTKPCSCSVLPQASAAGLPGVVLVGKRKLLKL